MSLRFNFNFTTNTIAASTKDIKMAVPLKCLSRFCKILGMPQVDCKLNLMQTWFLKHVITNSIGVTIFAITVIK